MNKQRLLLAAILAACTTLTACLNSSAVDDFAKVSAQAATLFRRLLLSPTTVVWRSRRTHNSQT